LSQVFSTSSILAYNWFVKNVVNGTLDNKKQHLSQVFSSSTILAQNWFVKNVVNGTPGIRNNICHKSSTSSILAQNWFVKNAVNGVLDNLETVQWKVHDWRYSPSLRWHFLEV
jgi:hypothetical protein